MLFLPLEPEIISGGGYLRPDSQREGSLKAAVLLSLEGGGTVPP